MFRPNTNSSILRKHETNQKQDNNVDAYMNIALVDLEWGEVKNSIISLLRPVLDSS